jgi:hypothetical protein
MVLSAISTSFFCCSTDYALKSLDTKDQVLRKQYIEKAQYWMKAGQTTMKYMGIGYFIN